VIVLAIAVVVMIALASWWLREQRRAGWRAAAAQHGLAYDLHDPFGTLDLGFRLFGMGDGNGIENVIHGTLGDLHVRVFDFWYWVRRSDSKGMSHRDYERFCCAVVQVPLRSPHTAIERENLLTRLADAIGFRDQEFESEEFNRRFQVSATDARFASYLIDARMMEWLMANGDDLGIELLDDAALVATGKMSPTAIGWLLDRAADFCAQIPRVARDVYGASSGAADA